MQEAWGKKNVEAAAAATAMVNQKDKHPSCIGKRKVSRGNLLKACLYISLSEAFNPACPEGSCGADYIELPKF